MSVRALAPFFIAPFAFLAADPPLAFPRDDAAPKAAEPQGRGFLAVRAGTIHLVEEDRVLLGGVVLVKDGIIQAVGTDVAIPADAEVIDYGPDAVVVPGLVAAFSPYALGMPGERSADPGLSALDGFDTFRVYGDALSGGVTSAYIAPAENRLIAGTGAVVKLGGERDAARVLAPAAAIHGAIDASARATGGYWEPPVPVIGNEELGWARPQLPRTVMGAIVALDELLGGSASPDAPALVAEYGRRAPADLARLLAAKVPLRIRAGDAHEIRALLELVARHRTPLVLDGADEAGELAAELAAADVPVVFRLPFAPNAASADRGKGEDDRWVELDVPARLVAAGVRVAITSSAPRDLLFAMRVASRGGLDPAAALRAVTLAPARMLGVASRVGSLAVGKDADLCVLNGDPLDPGASVLATWIGGELAWKAHRAGEATVVEVAELHVGDGEVLRPGQVLMLDGRIAEVGGRVSHPRGATVVRGAACMPGMIDAFGHLGLEGSRKVPATDFLLASIVEPGDEVDRRVALEGITTVVLTPRNASDSGAPVMAYKPAAREFERQVVGDPVALRFRWEDQNRLRSGQSVRELLAKAAEYRAKWNEYEQALAAWKPAPEPAAGDAKKDDAKAGDEKASDEKGDGSEAEKEGEAKKDDAKPKTKKTGEPAELEPDPITGVWETEAAPDAVATPVKLRLKLATPGASAAVEGNLRSDAVSRTLVEVEGWFDREKRELALAGVGSGGWVELTVKLAEGKLAGELRSGGETHAVALARTSKEYVVARRTERVPEKKEAPKEPKGKPKEPKRDDKLEPLRRAMDGKAAVIVEVDRAIDIVPCVEAFAAHGIRPVLHGASEAHLVADRIAGKVAGVLLAPGVVLFDPERGTDYRTPYAELQNAGIKVAFQSEAEEGAIDLPLRAAFAVAHGMSPDGALRALTADAADMLELDGRVGRLAAGLDADLLLLDGPPLDPATSVLRAWVNGREVEAP
jgi:imidazolonepropionase-like amidohydrolase